MVNSKKVRTRSITKTEQLFKGQKDMLLRHFQLYPSGILAEVMDTWNLWQVLTELLPDPEIKAAILARDGKLVIRPDSGDPVDIICGKPIPEFNTLEEAEKHFYKNVFVNGNILFRLNGELRQVITHSGNTFMSQLLKQFPQDKGVIELLWDVFGGTVNEQGYKVLDPHIGAIYGDSITLGRATEICERLKAKGFASTNIVLGIGSFTYQYNTRDTFGFAVKATYGEVLQETGVILTTYPSKKEMKPEVVKSLKILLLMMVLRNQPKGYFV
jgi:nicotinamide phosphoribosyltransferase